MATNGIAQSIIPRHAGMDWLRIGAFGLLILYHLGLYFGPWGWHIGSPHPVSWLIFPLLALNPWRMTLLFLVSGYAARALLSRTSPAAFLRSRATRLLLPLMFGVLVVMAPQPWVERSLDGSYPHGLLRYWLTDYLSMGDPTTPALNNLWFVLYIWAYSVVVGLGAWLLPASVRQKLRAGPARLLDGPQLLALPILWLLLIRLVWFPTMQPTNHVLHDLNGHLTYLPAFLSGMMLAGAPHLHATMHRFRWPAAMLALAGFGLILSQILLLGHEPPLGTPAAAIGRCGAAVMNWGMIVLLVGAVEPIRSGTSSLRATLNEAVFPSYIVHQTAIVLIAWWIRPLNLSNFAQFGPMLVGTCLACWFFYRLGLASGPFRPLFGLAPARPKQAEPRLSRLSRSG
ncbi:acyltransferase [uncultured Sphingomonas sp.]|uniref:acyltransferase family protein n=1 Tax=uncultured Sphingomonas sp. TaxID=158754 RepID=UPI0025F43B64|nr:acyltransferase [uncultured Sphingomonas sp.]